MTFLRACLFSLPMCGALLGPLLGGGLIAGAAAQPAVPAVGPLSNGPLPNALSRSGDVVMMLPIPDNGAGGLPGPRPSRIRVLSATDHDLYLRAFEAASRGDWTLARNLASQGQNSLARRLVEWRYALDKNSGANFAEIDAVIKDTESKTSAATSACVVAHTFDGHGAVGCAAVHPGLSGVDHGKPEAYD